jgi:hypothetical protein
VAAAASADAMFSPSVTVFSDQLSGGSYCFSLENRAPVSPSTPVAELSSSTQGWPADGDEFLLATGGDNRPTRGFATPAC